MIFFDSVIFLSNYLIYTGETINFILVKAFGFFSKFDLRLLN